MTAKKLSNPARAVAPSGMTTTAKSKNLTYENAQGSTLSVFYDHLLRPLDQDPLINLIFFFVFLVISFFICIFAAESMIIGL